MKKEDRENARTEGIPEGLQPNASLGSFILDYFEAVKDARKPFEEEWSECWRNFLGQYNELKKWKPSEGRLNRSRVFVKLTSLKCHTAHSKIMDASFVGNKVPFDFEAIDTEALGLSQDVIDEHRKAFKKRLNDHFQYIEAEELFDQAILELAILGTAVIKGPIVEKRKKTVVEKRMIMGVPASEWEGLDPYALREVEEIVPTFDHIPLWEYYVDPNARNTKDALGEIHFQRLLPGQFRQVTSIEGYNKDAVKAVYGDATIDDKDDMRYEQMADNYTGKRGDKDKRISILEYWGLAPVEALKDAECKDLPEDVEDGDMVEAMVVLGGNGTVLKVCLNPIGERVFRVCPYKKRPHCIYGHGVSYAMKDSQMMINSSARLIIDNKAMSGLGMIAVNSSKINLKKTKDLGLYAGKAIHLKDGVKPKDAIDSITFPDVTQGLHELIEMFMQFADEETALPKFTHGTQDTFLNKTARGMSMLMTQANVGLKSVMRNIDNYWLEPIVEALAEWFYEFGEGAYKRLPLKVKALGMNSLIANEILIENLISLLNAGASPQDAMFMDRIKIFKKIAEKMDVPDVIKSDEEIQALYAEMQKQADSPKDMREYIHLDKLYPYLHRSEQTQVLALIGIQPEEDENKLAVSRAADHGVRPPGSGPAPTGPEPPPQPPVPIGVGNG